MASRSISIHPPAGLRLARVPGARRAACRPPFPAVSPLFRFSIKLAYLSWARRDSNRSSLTVWLPVRIDSTKWIRELVLPFYLTISIDQRQNLPVLELGFSSFIADSLLSKCAHDIAKLLQPRLASQACM